jgi:hypothetical protein
VQCLIPAALIITGVPENKKKAWKLFPGGVGLFVAWIFVSMYMKRNLAKTLSMRKEVANLVFNKEN